MVHFIWLLGCWLLAAGCCRGLSVYSTKSQSHRGRRSRTVSLAWSGMASHAQNWAPISPTLPILHVLRPCSPLLLLCSALLCSVVSIPRPTRTYRTHRHLASPRLVARARLAVCLPSPRPFLNYTLHCARHLCRILSAKHNPTQPNSTQARTHTHTLIANLPTLIPSRPCSTLREGTRDTLTCLLRLLRPPSLDFFSTSFPRPPPLIL